MPRVSMGLPVRNGEQFLAQALGSLLEQTFTDFELIISDNASTDNTEAICREYAQRDCRIRYYRNQENIGARKNFNALVARCTGEYFKWGAHDDVCAPTFLERCVAVLDADPTVVAAYPMTVDIDDSGTLLEQRDLSWIRYTSGVPRAERGSSFRAHVRFRNLITTDYYVEEIFGLIRADTLRQTKLIQSFADSDRCLLAHLGLMGRLQEVPEVLFYHRVHDGAATNVNANWDDWTIWYDPHLNTQGARPMCSQFVSYLGMISNSGLRTSARIACYSSMLRWLWHKWPFVAMELARSLRRRSRRGQVSTKASENINHSLVTAEENIILQTGNES